MKILAFAATMLALAPYGDSEKDRQSHGQLSRDHPLVGFWRTQHDEQAGMVAEFRRDGNASLVHFSANPAVQSMFHWAHRPDELTDPLLEVSRLSGDTLEIPLLSTTAAVDIERPELLIFHRAENPERLQTWFDYGIRGPDPAKEHPLLGIWIAREDDSDDLRLLECRPDGLITRVRFVDGEVRDGPPGAWAEFADGSLGIYGFGSLDLANDTLVGEGRRFHRTDDPEHTQLMPGHGPLPEDPAAEPAATGIWVTTPSDATGSYLNLASDGTGKWIGMGKTTALGVRLRWTRSGETLKLITQGRTSREFDLTITEAGLEVWSDEGVTVLRRTNDPAHAIVLAEQVPLPPALRALGQDEGGKTKDGQNEDNTSRDDGRIRLRDCIHRAADLDVVDAASENSHPKNGS